VINAAFGPPPPRNLQIRPTAEEVAFFHEHGYLSVERITTDAELRWLEDAFRTVVLEYHASGRRTDGGESGFQQYALPEMTLPQLLDTTFRYNARRYAAALLGVSEDQLVAWGQFLWKRPHDGKMTPWHQDEAYWDPSRSYHAVAAWLPLHDCAVERGCMQFIPGSHRRAIMPHDLATDPEASRQLAALNVDFSTAVACPLNAGGVTFHYDRTLHYAGPNTTDEARTAFILEFQTPPTRRDVADERPWFEKHRVVGMPGTYVADGKLIPLP
jgi:ectoine hydroxylase-related dioxygenase (phytanoyl-CoA dioxygenase family)